MFKSEEELIESARKIHNRNSKFNHYGRWLREPKALGLIARRLREVGEAEKSIFYSDLFVDIEIINTNRGIHKIGWPEWSSFEDEMINNVLEYLTYNSYANHGFMVTALIINAKGKYKSLPGTDFLMLYNKIQAWPLDPPKLHPIDMPDYKILVKKHTQMAHEFYQSRRDARGILSVESLL